MQRFFKVLTTQGIADYYLYKGDEGIRIGTVVKVPFGRNEADGVVLGVSETPDIPESRIKEIAGVYDLQPLAREMIRFIFWMAEYTMSYAPQILRMVLAAALTTRTKKDIEPLDPCYAKVRLNEEQEAAAAAIKSADGFSVFLLNGVTGSGKTEVYFDAIVEKAKDGGQVLIMMPEIALGTNFVKRFKDRFGVTPLEWHSDLGKKEKREVWHSVYDGSAQVVIGARSALFLPFRKLAMIIVDEEHDTSYKQEDRVIYQARDMAVVRASIEKIPVILASATPSLESVINARAGRYRELTLKKRYNDATLPDIKTIDMRCSRPAKTGRKPGFISPVLLDEIKINMENGEQSLLFLNRRGYAPFVLCGACGYRYQCPNCSAWLVEHRRAGQLVCHQCNYHIPVTGTCVSCQDAHSLISCGPGIERIEAEIIRHFPEASVKTLSSENISRKNAIEQMKEVIEAKADIIIGTQILAKGYHFPNLTLVGVIDADMGLEGGDLRAMEKTYQLLNQVAGRAGREAKPGRVYLQTYNPGHLLMQALIKGSPEEFYSLEEKSRMNYKMPPFAQLAGIVVSAAKAEVAQKTAKDVAMALSRAEGTAILGPAPAAIFKVNNRYRYRLLLKAPKKFKLAETIKSLLGGIKIPSSVRIKVDINPYNFL